MREHTDRLLGELRSLVGQAQQLLDAGTDGSRRAGAGLLEAGHRAMAFEQQAVRRAREAADEMDRYAHEHPWRVLLGGVVLVAFVATVLALLQPSRRD